MLTFRATIGQPFARESPWLWNTVTSLFATSILIVIIVFASAVTSDVRAWASAYVQKSNRMVMRQERGVPGTIS